MSNQREIPIRTETIRLSQFLKLAGLAADGVEAKIRITGGEITVNGEVETRRGRKLRAGDLVVLAGAVCKVVDDVDGQD